MNKLYYGDCLTIMQGMKPESVDLIYLDPPFNSDRAYNNIYKDETGRPLPDQIEAFCDMWTLDTERERAIRRLPELLLNAGMSADVVDFWNQWMNALRAARPKLLAYLSYMMERLLVMKAILKPTGCIYLHCDPTASHYIKIMMDSVFGYDNFRNEIVWFYKTGGTSKRWFSKKHDTILFYSKTSSYLYNLQKEKSYLTHKYGFSNVDILEDDKGYYTVVGMRDVWDIPALRGNQTESMNFKTQKPLELLNRIIKSSSNQGDLVLDPFCGCATTLEAAQTLGRRWIGIDIAIHAVKRVARVRLQDRLGLVEKKDFEITGIPRNKEGARDLWERDKYHFQKWAVEEVDGFVTSKRTADGGVDGRLYFYIPHNDDLQSMLIEVKGGKNVGPNDLRALRGVLKNSTAKMAGLIIMDAPGEVQQRNFDTLMGLAGDLEIEGKPYAKLQLLTVDEILAGKKFDTPGAVGKRLAQPIIPGSKS